MLNAAGQEFGALDGDRLAVHVEALGHDPVGALDRVDQAGKRQAALVVLVLLLPQVERGVDQVAGLVVVHVIGEDAQPDPDLRRGQADARRVQHGFGEVLDQPAQLGVEVAHRLGRRAPPRVTEKTYRLDAHETSWTHDGDSSSVPVYPSGNLGRVELDAQGDTFLAGAPGGLRRMQRTGQRYPVRPRR